MRPNLCFRYVVSYYDSHAALDTLKRLFEAGKLKPKVQQVFDLAHTAEAFAVSKAGQVVGKVVVQPNAMDTPSGRGH